MSYETLDVLSDAGGDVSPVVRSTETAYADGYTQVVFNGRQRMYDKVSFTLTRGYDKTQPVYELLRDSLWNNKPFYYKFADMGASKLYVVSKDSLRHAHVAGLRWAVSATFEEWNGLP